MATASVPLDMIEKELTCSICLNLLREPKDLDCSHTFCFDCLKQYVQKKPTIECPECRHITIVPQGGLINLKTNLRAKNMVENLSKSASPRSSNKQMEVPMCPNHATVHPHFFCVTCSIPVCQKCLIQHLKPQHEIRELKEVMEEEEKLRRMKNQELDGVERKLILAKDKTKQEVKSQVQHAIAEVKAWEEAMDQNMDKTFRKRMTILQEKRIEWNRSITSGMSKLSIQDDALPHDMTVLHLEPGQVNFSSLGKVVNTSDNKKSTVSANQKQVASANKELKLTLFDEFDSFNALRIAANHSNLIAVADTGTISIYGKYNGGYKQQCQLRGNYTFQPVAISCQGKLFVCDGGVVKVFSPAGTHERSWPISADRIDAITLTPADMVVIGTSDKMIRVYQCDGTLMKAHQVNYEYIFGIACNRKQIAFNAGYPDYSVRVIDFVTGHTLWTLSMANPCRICYEQSSNTLLVSQGNVIKQYCSTTGRIISCLAKHGPLFPEGMTVTQDNKLLVADSKTVKIYNIN